MEKDAKRNILLGIFVTVGFLLLGTGIYIMGSQRNFFSTTTYIVSGFHDINGLQEGDNVRFRGIDVGTVSKISIENDTTVYVTMKIENKIIPFLRKNALAAIGTDGLMGNKIVNIHNADLPGGKVSDNDTIGSIAPIQLDEAMRTLTRTNDHIAEITEDLEAMMKRVSSSRGLWHLLNDSTLSDNLDKAIVNIRVTSDHTAVIAGDLRKITGDLKSGKGLAGALITDTVLSGNVRQSVVTIRKLSDTLAVVTGDMKNITQRMRSPGGSVGMLLSDTMFVRNLNESMKNFNKGSAAFNEDMEGLKHSILLRRYFRKQEKNSANDTAR